MEKELTKDQSLGSPSGKTISTTSLGEENINIVKTKSEVPQWALDIMEENKKMKEKVQMFEDMASKNELKSYLDAKKDNSIKTAGFKIFNNKIVIGWKELDYSKFNPHSMTSRGENILQDIVYEDDTIEKINYIDLVNCKDVVSFPIRSIVGEFATIGFPDGDKKISIKFLNA